MHDQAAQLDSHKLLRLKQIFTTKFGLPLQLADVQGDPVDVSAVERTSMPLCGLLAENAGACACCHLDHRRAIQTAFALGESYSFVCHAGLLVNCTPLMDGAARLGALLSGQTLPESFDPALFCETLQRLRVFGLDEEKLAAALKDHLFVPGQTLQEAGAFLFQQAHALLGLDPRGLTEQHERAAQQAQIAETIHAVKQRSQSGSVPYPYEREKELLQKVRAGDRHGAKAVLNEILGTILFRDPAGSPMFKIRLVELLVVVSRAAAEAGGDVEQVLSGNLVNIGEVLKADDHSELCVKISKALNDFLDTVCANRAQTVRTPLAVVVEYMEENHDLKLSVTELAKQAHLSPSRVSHLFKDEYGMSLLEMLAHIRIEQAKKLLLETNLSCMEVALRVGYQEQAYFTRIFARLEKVTPRQYRVLNR